MPLLSPPEYSYLRTSLLAAPPIRPDLRSPFQFRPLTAELTLLPGTHGSSRVYLPDGSECIVGIKPELIFSSSPTFEVSIEIAGLRDDDPIAVLLAGMISDTVRAQVTLQLQTPGRWSGAKESADERTWGWKLWIDVVVITPPVSHPGGLVSLAVHLALRDLRLPKLVSQKGEDPVFDDDYEASEWLFPRDVEKGLAPAVTLLVAAVGENVLFDPSRDEMTVADCVAAVSVTRDGKVGGIRLLEGPGNNGGVKRGVVGKITKDVGRAADGLFDSLDAIVNESL